MLGAQPIVPRSLLRKTRRDESEDRRCHTAAAAPGPLSRRRPPGTLAGVRAAQFLPPARVKEKRRGDPSHRVIYQ